MDPQIGYLQLLRRHGDFRRLWLADVASLLGDWLNTIAIYALVRALSDTPSALALVFVAKLLPNVFVAPFAGLLVDRFDRRRLMIAADLVRALIVCGFLFVGTDTPVAWVYVLAVAQVSVSAVFLPARSAATPNVVPADALATANALGAITWSTILTLGAGIGGVLVDWLGTDAVFALDAASYVLSAVLIARARIPQSTDAPEASPGMGAVLRGIGDGVAYMRAHPVVGRVALAKAGWTSGVGAIYFMFVIIAPTALPDAPSTAIGALYAAAGLGTGIGPVLARTWVPETRWPLLLGVVIALGGVIYGVFALLPWGPAVLLLVTAAHACGGANWVMSTVLLQRRSEDRFRGRVFANEMIVLTAANAATIALAAALLESGAVSARLAIAGFAAVNVVAGIAYLLWSIAGERRGAVP